LIKDNTIKVEGCFEKLKEQGMDFEGILQEYEKEVIQKENELDLTKIDNIDEEEKNDKLDGKSILEESASWSDEEEELDTEIELMSKLYSI